MMIYNSDSYCVADDEAGKANHEGGLGGHHGHSHDNIVVPTEAGLQVRHVSRVTCLDGLYCHVSRVITIRRLLHAGSWWCWPSPFTTCLKVKGEKLAIRRGEEIVCRVSYRDYSTPL